MASKNERIRSHVGALASLAWCPCSLLRDDGTEHVSKVIGSIGKKDELHGAIREQGEEPARSQTAQSGEEVYWVEYEFVGLGPFSLAGGICLATMITPAISSLISPAVTSSPGAKSAAGPVAAR
jgi:hypothetical protein